MKIRKGDLVKILSGKEKGKESVVERVITASSKIVVKGVHVVKRHTKSSGRNVKGGIISKEMPIAVSKVMLVCPKCKKPTRVGFSIVAGKKYRKCGKCKEVIMP